MVEQFELVPGFQLVQDQIRKAYSVEDEAVRGTTKFEARGERLGHDIRDLVRRNNRRSKLLEHESR